MNRHGYAVALPGYRLCPEVAVADIIADLRAAVLYLHRRFGTRFVVAGHSAGGHLAAAMVATDWLKYAPDAPADLLRSGLAVSGLFDLAPLIDTSLNNDLQLDPASAAAASPAFWPVPAGVTFEAWVGGTESAEYLRQSRLVAERWSAAGATTRFNAIADANHFTAPMPLADAESTMVAKLVQLAEKVAQA
jgi:arylformamidase